MIDMEIRPPVHGFMVHVFVNGFTGEFTTSANAPESSHYAAYNGGDDSLLDARNGSSVVDGSAKSLERHSSCRLRR